MDGSMDRIFEEIRKERDRQDAKWGVQNHSPIEYCAILGEEVGEVNKEALEYHFQGKYYDVDSDRLERYRKELIQVGAVVVAMLQSLERNESNQVSKIDDPVELCEHNWRYDCHGHNYDVYICTKCGLGEER